MAVHLGKCQMKLFAAFNRLVGINFSSWSKSEKPLGWLVTINRLLGVLLPTICRKLQKVDRL